MACAVTDDTHTVAKICEFCQAVNILINDNQIMTFFSQSVNKRITDLAGADYDDLQSSFAHKSDTK